MSEHTPYLFTGLRVAPRDALAGSKRAVKMGSTVYVSRAMFELMRHADERELRLLLEKIELVEIPEPPGLYEPIPMVTLPPPADSFTRDIAVMRRMGFFGLF